METALALRKDQEFWGKRIGECAIGGLLALKNDAWRDDDEPEITASEFLERISVRTISVTPQGEFVFWHDDDDLFWGHAIQVSGTRIDGPTDASIAG